MRLTATQSTALWKRLASLSFLFALCFSMAAQNGCEDDAGNVYGPYEVLVVSDDPCENFTCAQTAFGFTWVINAEYLDDCSGEDDEDGNDGVEDLDLEEWAIYLDSLCNDDQLDGSHYVYCCLLERLNACAEGDESACEELIEWIETGEGPCAEDDGDDEDDDEEGEGGGEEECLVEFEFEQATDEAGLPLPYNVIAYVDEPDADTYYFWTFGDGMESDEPNPTHVYEEVGNYEVCLTVTQVMGNQFTCTAVYCDTLMIDTDGLVRQQLTLNVVIVTRMTLSSTLT
ncbi:MAG: PKD domain-containing protein [Flavobacteriales bacterium]